MPEWRVTSVSDDEKVARDVFKAGGSVLGFAAGMAMRASANAKVKAEERERDTLAAELKQTSHTYFAHTISGVSCPRCSTQNEEGQWHCYMCGFAL